MSQNNDSPVKSTSVTLSNTKAQARDARPKPHPSRLAWLRSSYLFLPALIPFFILLITGIQGVNFGYHWDDAYHRKEISGSVQKLILLPDGLYDYPSMCYWIELLVLLPSIVHSAQLVGIDIASIQNRLLEVIQSDNYLLRVRVAFLGISSLSVLWVYILIVVWRKSWLEAFVASCILAGSWELAYHIRWIAPDGVLTQFGVLTMLFVVLTQKHERQRLWLRCAAVTAGLACGTKYPGGLFIVPVLLAAYQLSLQNLNKHNVYRLLIEVCAIFGLTYLLTTPGTFLQTSDFYRGIYVNDMLWYGDSHMGYTVTPGISHLQRILIYFSTILLSPYAYGALIFFTLAMIGLYNIIKERSPYLYTYLSFPLLYIIYFSMQHVMIVRNLLVLVPFLAVLSARGFTTIWHYRSEKPYRIAISSILGLILLLNNYWLFDTAQTIANRTSDNPIAKLASYIDERQIIGFYVTERVYNELVAYDGKQRPNITKQLYPITHSVVFYASEGFDDTTPANDPALTSTWFGTWEVNYNYYPTWASYDRIIVMPHTKAIDAHVNFLKQK